jgi:DNA polymerase-3 subunit delta
MFYIFHGDDAHSQKETLAELIGRLGDPSMLELNTTHFSGQVAFAQLRQVCNSVPFLTKRRLVICQDTLSSQPDRALVDELITYLPQLPESTRLFFLESRSLPANHRLLRLAEESENGYVRAFDRPEGAALNRWVQERAGEKGGEITPRAVHMLVTNIGNELELLDNELEKLVLYTADMGPIDAEHVALLCPYAAEASIFDLVDALGSRNGRQAATTLQRKLNEGRDPFYLFAMIVRQFRLLIQVKELAEAGQHPPAIGKALRLHPFVAGKLHRQSQHFSLAQLEKIYAHLLQTDVGVKTGRADMLTSLNLLVAALA